MRALLSRPMVVAGAVVVIALVMGAWLLSRDVTSEGPADLPTFGSTPSPVEYGSLDELASELETDGLPCGELEYQEMNLPGQRGIEEFATCYLKEDRALNVELWLFDNTKKRDLWVNQFQTATLVVTGPNWAVTPQDHRRAKAVMGSLGGDLSGRLPD